MAHDLGQSKNQVEQETRQSHTHSSQSPAAVAEKKVPFSDLVSSVIIMARIPHGQPNQAFPSSSCSEILVTFPLPPPPPPPCLFLSLPAATARSLSFKMFRHARRLASIRILMKQTKEPRRLRETARETTSSEPNSCNISSPYPATREIRLLLAPDESATYYVRIYLRATLDSITKISAARPTYFRWARLSDLPCTLLRKAQRRLLSESEDWWSRGFWRETLREGL